MVALLQPIYLLALLGLLIPLAIHLWSRREGRIRKVGTIRWMQKSTSRRFSKIKLQNWLLLLIRAAIICIIVLIMAELVWKKPQTNQVKKWALVEPEILDNAYAREDYLPALEREGYEIRQLAYAFKKIDIQDPETEARDLSLEEPQASVSNIWEIVKAASLVEKPADSLLVLTRGCYKNFSGTKPEIDVHTSWMIFPEKSTQHFIYDARYLPHDSIVAKIGKSSGDETRIHRYIGPLQNIAGAEFDSEDARIELNLRQDTLFLTRGREILDSRIVRHSETLNVAIAYNDTTRYAARIWRAAMQALSQHQKIPMKISLYDHIAETVPQLADFQWFVDLSAGVYDFRDDTLTTVFSNSFPKDSLDVRWFIEKKGYTKKVYSINRDLQQQEDIQSLPEEIQEILRKSDPTVLNDLRTLDVHQVELPRVLNLEQERIKNETLYSSQKAEPFLWLLVVVLMVIERIVALRKNTA